MIHSILKGKGITLLTFLMFLISSSAFAQTADNEDFDGDGVLNGADFDDDNDGILDVDEYDCPVGGSALVWGTPPVWTGGDPEDDFSSVASTTIDGTVVTADNSNTDFVTVVNYNANTQTFNGTDGLLLQSLIGELDDSPIVYEIRFDRPVTGLSFSAVDIDKRTTLEAPAGNPYTERLTVSIFKEGTALTLDPTDYTFGSAVDDLGGGVFEGNSLVAGNTDIGDVNFTLGKAVDRVVFSFLTTEVSTSAQAMAFLISDMTWDCAYRDFDVDTLADHFDTDSDGDTCVDALEGDGGFTLADVDADDSLGDTVDLNGIPTVAGAGQADVSSTNAAVTSDECDDDGDGVINVTDGVNSLNPCLPVQVAGYTGYDASNAIWAAADCDADTILNGDEDTNGTDPYNVDTDGDGTSDDAEATPAEAIDPCLPVQPAGYTGYDATNALWAAGDCDGDTVLNGDEDTNGTDPYNADTDGDGTSDGAETTPAEALDPCLPVQAAGYTGYDATNAIWAAADCDADTILNGDEDTNGTDPYNVDTDGDGTNDDVEATPAEAIDPCLPVQPAGYTGYDATNAIWAAGDCDSDTVLNGEEDTNGTDPYVADTDGDGTGDGAEATPAEALDPCLPVRAAGYAGYDGTNAIWAAADCDGDTVLNGDEDTNGTDPYNGDTDGDGVTDDAETTPAEAIDPCLPAQAAGYTGYDATNAVWAAADCDGDTVLNGDEDTNGTDPYNGDTDGDGTTDDVEATPAEAIDPCLPVQAAGYTGYDATNAIWAAADCDSDGLTNGLEVTNGTDPYSMVDTDGDGIDDDNEVNNGTDAADPCDPVQAPGYTGYDAANATWAAADCDSDGVTNGDEVTNGTDPYEASPDTDGDGILDDAEVNNGSDPNDSCDPVQSPGYTGYDAANPIWAAADCDSDGLTNSEEVTLGTEIYNADTDGDTINDGQEVTDGTNPFDDCDSIGGTPLPETFCDRDNDGLSDQDEADMGTDPDNPDTDGDTIEDGQEVADGTDPLDPCDSEGGTPPQGTICGVEIGNSILTPDGDGINDVFRIENIELFANNSVEIVNRWGATVFRTDNYDNNSNAFAGIANTGASLNKGNVLPAGVYFYVINYIDEGRSRNASGYLYINQ
ncbi:gliding motility-associated C-terminal domain-containing protein [Flagellimonas algicola]|uniref:Gliding motility-associated-like protein n=1 Tax=Flagellimonas algicola TaxID=2583815 RepID=A0ABY2WNS8_9FLAO|nr:gliding motility-associated C-terminal domain-containing protein [Allomuricauda algicola]TMU56184.1 hypothetical protein FGG15_01195 [Allomuricauda algicola]